MNYLRIECDSISVESKSGTNNIIVETTKPDLVFLGDIKIEDLVKGYDNRELFDAIIENDEEILHEYLTSHGYVFNKN